MTVILVSPGSLILHLGQKYVVRRFNTAEQVIALNLSTGIEEAVPISGIRSPNEGGNEYRADLMEIPTGEWNEAIRRYRLIEPLLDKAHTKKDVLEIAQDEKVDPVTIYRWITKFTKTRLVTSLLRKHRKDRGAKRLGDGAEKIVIDVINQFYLSKQQRRLSQTYREVARRCRQAKIEPPHINTLNNRIRAVAPRTIAFERRGENAALKFRPIKGTIPGADYPLAVVQIDHTVVDIVLVDEVHRIPIRRPWITLAMDVYSRMVVGFYISFDPPGMLGTGLCIANSVLPKDKILERYEISATWPCQGLMKTIHLDNAKEFRGVALSQAANKYGIDLKFRKLKKPQYGGHIERLLGTLLGEIHALPGSTFSNPKAKGEYDSEAEAAMTIAEFEEWLTHLIVGVYHQRVHSQLGMPPIEKYQAGILGDEHTPGVGALPVVVDASRFKMDFLPFQCRTIQNYGVMMDNIIYQGDVLARWIGALENEHRKSKRKFIFRRDPRDISYLWFFDPDAGEYFRIPYQNTGYPPISLWELRAVQDYLKKQGRKNVDQKLVFDTYEQMLRIEESSVGKTKSRKFVAAQERRRIHREQASQGKAPAEEVALPEEIDISTLKPFDEVEDM